MPTVQDLLTSHSPQILATNSGMPVLKAQRMQGVQVMTERQHTLEHLMRRVLIQYIQRSAIVFENAERKPHEIE